MKSWIFPWLCVLSVAANAAQAPPLLGKPEPFRRLPDDGDAGIVLEQVLKERLGGVLDGEKADVFLDVVSDAFREYPRVYRGILEGVVLAHADSFFWKHAPSPEQSARLAAVMGRVPVLEGALASAGGVGDFFPVLDAVAPLPESGGEDAELKRFFDSRGASIEALGPSPEQAGRLSKHVRILSVASLVGETIKTAWAAANYHNRDAIVWEFVKSNIDVLSVDDFIRLASTMYFEYHRDHAIWKFVKSNIDVLSVDDFRRLALTMYFEYRRDHAIWEFVKSNIDVLSVDDFRRLASTMYFEYRRDHAILKFVQANTGRLTREDLRRLTKKVYNPTHRDRILRLVSSSCVVKAGLLL